MPRFTPKRYEQILPQMISRVVTRTRLSDVADSSSVKHVLAAAARSDDEQYYQMVLLLQLFSIDTAQGEDLDERAKDIQPAVVSRRQAVKSTGVVVFSRAGTTGTVNIPIGTKVKTSDGAIFTTTSVGTITPSSPEKISGHGVGRDSNDVAVVADQPGTAGNVVADTIIKFDTKPVGVDEVTNQTALINGLDEETDDSFRNRLKAFVASLARCTVSAIEVGVIGQQDPETGQTILFAKVVEDIINRGDVTLYVDDGTGAAESVAFTAVALAATYTWNGSTTVASADTSEVSAGDWIRLDSDDQWFEIQSIVPNTSVTIANPGALTIPTGSTQSSVATDILTEGLTGPPPGSAVGGEEELFLDHYPVKAVDPLSVYSSTRGPLVKDTDFIINYVNGQLVFTPSLSTGEIIMADYTYFTGLLALAQKIVDGDPNDRLNYPGLRAAGILVTVATPTILLQTVNLTLATAEGYEFDPVKEAVRQAIKDYINNLNISDDVIRNKLISQIMAVPGVINILLTAPAVDIPILDDQLARVQNNSINII
jgi:uncharacterized phage protein gp47/JayE